MEHLFDCKTTDYKTFAGCKKMEKEQSFDPSEICKYTR